MSLGFTLEQQILDPVLDRVLDPDVDERGAIEVERELLSELLGEHRLSPFKGFAATFHHSFGSFPVIAISLGIIEITHIKALEASIKLAKIPPTTSSTLVVELDNSIATPPATAVAIAENIPVSVAAR